MSDSGQGENSSFAKNIGAAVKEIQEESSVADTIEEIHQQAVTDISSESGQQNEEGISEETKETPENNAEIVNDIRSQALQQPVKSCSKELEMAPRISRQIFFPDAEEESKDSTSSLIKLPQDTPPLSQCPGGRVEPEQRTDFWPVEFLDETPRKRKIIPSEEKTPPMLNATTTNIGPGLVFDEDEIGEEASVITHSVNLFAEAQLDSTMLKDDGNILSIPELMAFTHMSMWEKQREGRKKKMWEGCLAQGKKIDFDEVRDEIDHAVNDVLEILQDNPGTELPFGMTTDHLPIYTMFSSGIVPLFDVNTRVHVLNDGAQWRACVNEWRPMCIAEKLLQAVNSSWNRDLTASSLPLSNFVYYVTYPALIDSLDYVHVPLAECEIRHEISVEDSSPMKPQVLEGKRTRAPPGSRANRVQAKMSRASAVASEFYVVVRGFPFFIIQNDSFIQMMQLCRLNSKNMPVTIVVHYSKVENVIHCEDPMGRVGMSTKQLPPFRNDDLRNIPESDLDILDYHGIIPLFIGREEGLLPFDGTYRKDPCFADSDLISNMSSLARMQMVRANLDSGLLSDSAVGHIQDDYISSITPEELDLELGKGNCKDTNQGIDTDSGVASLCSSDEASSTQSSQAKLVGEGCWDAGSFCHEKVFEVVNEVREGIMSGTIPQKVAKGKKKKGQVEAPTPPSNVVCNLNALMEQHSSSEPSAFISVHDLLAAQSAAPGSLSPSASYNLKSQSLDNDANDIIDEGDVDLNKNGKEGKKKKNGKKNGKEGKKKTKTKNEEKKDDFITKKVSPPVDRPASMVPPGWDELCANVQSVQTMITQAVLDLHTLKRHQSSMKTEVTSLYGLKTCIANLSGRMELGSSRICEAIKAGNSDITSYLKNVLGENVIQVYPTTPPLFGGIGSEENSRDQFLEKDLTHTGDSHNISATNQSSWVRMAAEALGPPKSLLFGLQEEGSDDEEIQSEMEVESNNSGDTDPLEDLSDGDPEKHFWCSTGAGGDGGGTEGSPNDNASPPGSPEESDDGGGDSPEEPSGNDPGNGGSGDEDDPDGRKNRGKKLPDDVQGEEENEEEEKEEEEKEEEEKVEEEKVEEEKEEEETKKEETEEQEKQPSGEESSDSGEAAFLEEMKRLEEEQFKLRTETSALQKAERDKQKKIEKEQRRKEWERKLADKRAELEKERRSLSSLKKKTVPGQDFDFVMEGKDYHYDAARKSVVQQPSVLIREGESSVPGALVKFQQQLAVQSASAEGEKAHAPAKAEKTSAKAGKTSAKAEKASAKAEKVSAKAEKASAKGATSAATKPPAVPVKPIHRGKPLPAAYLEAKKKREETHKSLEDSERRMKNAAKKSWNAMIDAAKQNIGHVCGEEKMVQSTPDIGYADMKNVADLSQLSLERFKKMMSPIELGACLKKTSYWTKYVPCVGPVLDDPDADFRGPGKGFYVLRHPGNEYKADHGSLALPGNQLINRKIIYFSQARADMVAESVFNRPRRPAGDEGKFMGALMFAFLKSKIDESPLVASKLCLVNTLTANMGNAGNVDGVIANNPRIVSEALLLALTHFQASVGAPFAQDKGLYKLVSMAVVYCNTVLSNYKMKLQDRFGYPKADGSKATHRSKVVDIAKMEDEEEEEEYTDSDDALSGEDLSDLSGEDDAERELSTTPVSAKNRSDDEGSDNEFTPEPIAKIDPYKGLTPGARKIARKSALTVEDFASPKSYKSAMERFTQIADQAESGEKSSSCTPEPKPPEGKPYRESSSATPEPDVKSIPIFLNKNPGRKLLEAWKLEKVSALQKPAKAAASGKPYVKPGGKPGGSGKGAAKRKASTQPSGGAQKRARKGKKEDESE